MSTPRRRTSGYFPTEPDAPPPITVRVTQRIHFSDVDAMAILWHGRYAKLFEVANEALGQVCGMTYRDFHDHRLQAPIVQLHVDYFAPVLLAEEVTITGRLVWHDGARMNIEYQVHKPDGILAAAGYTVQMFIDEQAQPIIALPTLYDAARTRWLAGELPTEPPAQGRQP